MQLFREGDAGDVPVKITKGLTLDAGSGTLQVAYLLEDLPQDRPLHFAVEMNFAGLPPAAAATATSPTPTASTSANSARGSI